MPCNADHMEPTAREVEAAKIYSILDELDEGRDYVIPTDYDGFHPMAYGSYWGPSGQARLDKITAELCGRLSAMTKEEIREQSLELQIWWRNHQAWDEKRKRAEG